MPHHMENSGIYVKMAYHKMKPTPSAFNQLVMEIICNDMNHSMPHNSNTVLHYLDSASSLQQWTIIHLIINNSFHKIPSCEKTKI